MKQNKGKRSSEKGRKKDVEHQLKLIHTLATRLPWIAVILVLISMVFILLEVLLRNGG